LQSIGRDAELAGQGVQELVFLRWSAIAGSCWGAGLGIDDAAERLIDRCSLAHTVYNTFTYAEFVCKRPTPLIVDNTEVASIYHYSLFKNLAVTTELFAQ
jgi:hypothetical protein